MLYFFCILERLGEQLSSGGRSFFVHCQGTRARSCRERTDTISSLFLDLAIEQELPIVPVRFCGGLPVEPIEGKLEFFVGHTRQDYWVGRPIAAADSQGAWFRELVAPLFGPRGPEVRSAS